MRIRVHGDSQNALLKYKKGYIYIILYSKGYIYKCSLFISFEGTCTEITKIHELIYVRSLSDWFIYINIIMMFSFRLKLSHYKTKYILFSRFEEYEYLKKVYSEMNSNSVCTPSFFLFFI